MREEHGIIAMIVVFALVVISMVAYSGRFLNIAEQRESLERSCFNTTSAGEQKLCKRWGM